MADEESVFEAGQEEPTEGPFEYKEEELNLVSPFKGHSEGRRALSRIGNHVLDVFKEAWDANEKYRANMADTWKLFAGTLDPKPPDFAHLSNAHVPILMEETIRMVSRQAYELFGNWSRVFGVIPLGPDDDKTAKLLSLHGNWQIRKKIKDFKREVGHRGLLIFNLFGDVTCHSYWDPQRRANRHEILTAAEFVCSNSHVSTMPDYSDVSWVAKVMHMDAHELRKMDTIWEGVATTLERLPPEWEDGEYSRELRDAVDKSTGVDSTSFTRGQYRIVQWEGWLNLPGQDRDRYCKVIVDTTTRAVLSLGIHERVDAYDKRRFEFETEQLQRYQAAVAEIMAFEEELEATKLAAIEAGAGGGAQDATGAILAARNLDMMPRPPEPVMPDWMAGNPEAEPAPPRSEPIRMFVHGVNIEPLQGVMGIGTGAIHAAQNKAANIALSMFIDQGMLGNMKNFLAKAELRFPEKLKMQPGKVHKVTGSTNLAQDIVPLDFGQANPQLLQLIEMFVRFGHSVSNTPEVLTGEPGKSGETAQGMENRVEQATKVLTVPTGKYADFCSFVLVNNAALNATFLEDVEWFSVNNHDPQMGDMGHQFYSVGREMYDRPYDVEITADLKFTSTSQRIAEADALVQMPQAVPELAGNGAFKHAVVSKSLEARNRHDLVALLGAPPPPPQVYGAPTSPPAPPPGQPPQPPPQGQGGPQQ